MQPYKLRLVILGHINVSTGVKGLNHVHYAYYLIVWNNYNAILHNTITKRKGSGLHHPLCTVPSMLRQPDWTVPGAAPWGTSYSTEEGGCAVLGSCWTYVYIRPPDGLVQGQGYELSPSHPDPVSIGVLAHPVQAGSSQQREGHAARTLHRSAEVITQPTGIDFPFYDYHTIIIIITYYCMALYLII